MEIYISGDEAIPSATSTSQELKVQDGTSIVELILDKNLYNKGLGKKRRPKVNKDIS